MKKVFLYNLNVGSGVEYSGNVIAEWCKELPINFFEYKEQNPPCLSFDPLIEIKPDIIIINDNCPRVVEPPYYFKRCFPKTKVIYLTHGIKELYPPNNISNMYENYDRLLLYIATRDYFDIVVSFGYIKNDNEIPSYLKERFLKGCFPINPENYCVKTPWYNRKKLFCYVGQLNNLKFSLDFLKQLKDYDSIQIDCYGYMINSYINEEYQKAIKIKQINYKGLLEQEKVPEILNEYKYFILPHGRIKEIFNISLLQSMCCGTIPLVCNDRTADFDYTWIDWAHGLYTPHNTEEMLLKTITSPTLVEKDYSYLSNYISKQAKERFDYYKFKNEFQQMMKGWL
jgi:hypothetical protein